MKLKKAFTTAVTVVALFAMGSSAFAANMVSQMATEKGGRHVASCAQMMEQGVSACATATHECSK